MKKIYIFLWVIVILSVANVQGLRDPFFLPSQEEESQDIKLSLVGVIKSGDKVGALIKRNGKEEMVFKDDKIHGYLVTRVTDDSVMLVRAKDNEQILVT